jgi:hypothetical protein
LRALRERRGPEWADSPLGDSLDLNPLGDGACPNVK